MIVAGPDEAGLLDAIFAYDPSLMTDAGAVLLRPGKELRLPEVELAERTYAELGIPIIGRIEAPGTVEGGDTLWLDERTLAVGRGYRTNDEGIRQLRAMLAPHGVEVMTVDLPHWRGPGECLHLMSFISPVAERLAVVYLPLMSVPFVAGAAAPRVVVHRGPGRGVRDARLQRAGAGADAGAGLRRQPRSRGLGWRPPAARSLVYKGDEISHNRAGGPTCLTRPILRACGRHEPEPSVAS